MKVKGTEEILGGYNPLKWDTSKTWGKTKDSFIFSFRSKNTFFKDAILSKVEKTDHAIVKDSKVGLCFYDDLVIGSTTVYGVIDAFGCNKFYYEKNISDDEGDFPMEDYEVFQILER